MFRTSDARQRVRVLWVNKALGWGGAEALLLEAAAQHDHRRFEIHVACQMIVDEDYVDRLAAHQVEIHVLAASNASRLSAAFGLPRLLRSLRPDIVHVHSPLLGSLARIACFVVRPRPRLITTEHSPWSSYHPLTRTLNAVTTQMDDCILAVSSESLASIHGPVRRRSETLVHGINVKQISQDYAVGIARRNQQVAPLAECFRLINVGNLRNPKDQATLLRALRIVSDVGHIFHCQILGEGPLRGELEQLVVELGLSAQVDMMGTRSDVLALMDSSDVLVISSVQEGLPLVLMEALSLGLPVISTAVGGIEEQMSGSTACILCEPQRPDLLAEAIIRAIDDPERRAVMSRQATIESAKFDSRNVVRQIEKRYLRMVSN